jgi:hypothetical protein
MRRTSASLAAAFMLTAIASPAAAGSTDYLLELGGVQGESQDDKHKNQIEILSYSWGATQSSHSTGGGGMGAGKVSMQGISAPTAPGGEGKTSKVDAINIKQNVPASAAGGVQVAVGDVTGDGADAASGLPTGKRQHKPLILSMPLATGSVTVRGKFPGCMVGARYPTMRLGNAARRYTLQDAVITSCATVRGGAAPMEEVSFNYAKIN